MNDERRVARLVDRPAQIHQPCTRASHRHAAFEAIRAIFHDGRYFTHPAAIVKRGFRFPGKVIINPGVGHVSASV